MKTPISYKIFRSTALIIFLILALFPIYWIVNTSFKPIKDAVSVPIQYFPKNFTWQNYIDIFRLTNFSQFFVNSFIVASISAFFTVIVSLFASYGIARFKFKGKNAVMLTLLVTQMVPLLVLIVPLFITFADMSLIDTRTSLIIPYTVIAIPFCTLMLVSFLKQVPYSIEEAAMIDGCTRIKSLFTVVIPIMMAGIVSSIIFSFISSWNELFFSIMFINSEELKTIPAGISMFIQKVDVNWASMTAAATISMTPIIIMFFFVQKYLVQGLSAGSVKG